MTENNSNLINENNKVGLGKGSTVLTEKEKVREKISIWHGSNSEWMQIIKELVGNSLDIKAKSILIKILNKNHIIFKDDGYGLPVELEASDGRPNYQAIFEILFAGSKYDKEEATVGTNGVFLATLMFSSYRLKCTVARPNGNIYQIEYSQGNRLCDMKIIGETKNNETFTELEFVLDEEVWDSPNFTFENICNFTKPQSALQEVNIEVIDVENNKEKMYNYHSIDNYFDDYEEKMKNVIKENLRLKRKLEKETIIKKRKKIDEIEFDLLFNFSPNDAVLQKEFLNTADLVEYGTIQKGIVEGIKKSISNDMYSNKNLRNQTIEDKDILSGLNYICNFKSKLTEYTNQTKRSTKVSRYVGVLRDEIVDFFEVYKAENPDNYQKILKKIELNVKSRYGAESKRKEIAKKIGFKISTNNKVRVKGLQDCDMKNIPFGQRILVSCEGVSAMTTVQEAMGGDGNVGLVCLGGRFINSIIKPVENVLNNRPAYTLIRATGAGIEIPYSERKGFEDIKSFDIKNLRYNKIVLMSDADSFGAAINMSQLALFYRYMPQVVKEGHIYVARTPRFKITLNRGNDVIYAYDQDDLDRIKRELVEKNTNFKINIFKGLGEFDKQEFYDLVLSEEGQKKSFVKVEYNQELKDEIDRLFELFMGSDTDVRKDYIQKNIVGDNEVIDGGSADICELLKNYYKLFAEDLVLNNLPSIDGLIRVQRKVIYSNYLDKVTPDKNFKKMRMLSANAMKFYVYGDAALEEAMKNMGNNNVMFKYIDPKGSFGNKNKRDGCGAAARYIEGRLHPYAMEMVKGISKKSVPMMDNFDATIKEPVVLPSIIPNILLNPSLSISTGYSSKIPSFNSIEICDNIIDYIENNNLEKLYTMSPDFPTGAKILFDKNSYQKIFETGRGSFKQLSTYTFDEKKSILSIKEIPNDTYIENIEDEIEELRDNGELKEITNIHNNSGIKGLSLDITLKKGCDVKKLIAKLRKKTSFEKTYNVNFTLLDNDFKTPKLMSLKKVVDNWIDFRTNCIKNETQYDIKLDKIKKEILEGFEKVLSDIGETINIIQKSESDNQAIQSLKTKFGLSDLQAEKICDIRLIKLNKRYLSEKIEDLSSVIERIKENEEFIKNENKIKEKIIEQLQEFKNKFGKERLTEIVYEDKLGESLNEISIENYNTQLYLTRDGYFKKIKLIENKGNNKLKDDDRITKSLPSTNKSEIIFITNKCNGYKKWGYELENNSMNSYGNYLPNYLDLEEDEYVTNVISIDDYNKGQVCHIYYDKDNKLVKMAKVKPEAYQTKTNRTKLNNCINSDLTYINSIYTIDDISVFSISQNGRAFIYNSKNINVKVSKDTMGINIMKDIDLYKSMFVNSNDSIEFTTEKGKDIRLTLSDLHDDNRTWYDYLEGKNASKGNYLLSNRKDKIIELKINN